MCGLSSLRRDERGFTLVELLVVIAIIGVLAVIIAPNAFKAVNKSQNSKTVSDLKAVKSAVQSYYADTGQWPSDHYILNDNGPLFKSPSGVAGWNGPYLERYGKSPLVRNPAPGRSYPGWYYIWKTKSTSGTYCCWFDLDNDGTVEVKDGISVCLYGLSLADALRIDQIFDGEGKVGSSGTVNVLNLGGENGALIALLIGRTGNDQN
ncbi:type II secretion system protein [Desulforamulus putei]|uniref:type II secretion system protein n=1 Tax=Desulforamulus putei TaxID=74701 RepID=UPI002FDE0CC8